MKLYRIWLDPKKDKILANPRQTTIIEAKNQWNILYQCGKLFPEYNVVNFVKLK